ncbi:MAG: preprotein translocase subunit SecA, partial [Deltaproteobacteria bacterium]|nr:preprotein translocase subunit SecA [Deltaproteobacteria bacterium]
AIVDEVDSILIDEARTPLIISGATEDSTEMYYQINGVIPGMRKEEHYTIDEKARSVMLTEAGVERVQKTLGIENLYDPEHIETLHHVNQALRAHTLYQIDRDYIVKEGEVVIVDEFTGRLMPGRRWSDGLHQAIEAKERVKIESENQTLATITFQNFFRMYDKLAGMTGTADTEAVEFKKIYDLDVLVVPTHRDMIRVDNADIIYRNAKEKFKAVVERIAECHEKGQPVLVGTISIEKNEMMSVLLKRRGIPHEILNAKNHEREAEIIAQAGRKGQVTLATNMAGRGTDIILGGNADLMAKARWRYENPEEPYDPARPECHAMHESFKGQCEKERGDVLEAGGLMVLGTERHESRRIDNQLRGRSGRQGDPGESVFYLALDDDLMRIFGSERMDSMLAKLGVREDEPIFHPWITKAIANAQQKVEGHNFDIRKRLLEYDDVMNKQREVVYSERLRVLEGEALRDDYLEIAEDLAAEIIAQHCDEKAYPENWPWNELIDLVRARWGLDPFVDYQKDDDRMEAKADDLREKLKAALVDYYTRKESAVGEAIMRDAERYFMLTTIDQHWKEHLYHMDHLRDGIGLRGYAQENPLLAYKRESFGMFQEMMGRIREQAFDKVMKFVVATDDEMQFRRKPVTRKPVNYGREALRQTQRPEASPDKGKPVPIKRTGLKVGPNDPCPCGSGKKYKKCCRDKEKAAAGA